MTLPHLSGLLFSTLLLTLTACHASVTGGGDDHGTSASAEGTGDQGGGGSCDSTITIVVDGAAPVELTSMCSPLISSYNPTGSTVPIGNLYLTTNLSVVGCVGGGAGAQGIWLSIEGGDQPEESTAGTLQYTDPAGVNSEAPMGALDVVVTGVGAVGEAIEGTFSGTTDTAGPTFTQHIVTGSFHVCRVPDDSGA